jgi:hypothetical protein
VERPPVLIENARKNSVAVQRHKISKEQGEQVKKLERDQGHAAALGYLLSIIKLK